MFHDFIGWKFRNSPKMSSFVTSLTSCLEDLIISERFSASRGSWLKVFAFSTKLLPLYCLKLNLKKPIRHKITLL